MACGLGPSPPRSTSGRPVRGAQRWDCPPRVRRAALSVDPAGVPGPIRAGRRRRDAAPHRAAGGGKALRLSAPALRPSRNRQQRPDRIPFRVRHVSRIPANPFGMISRVSQTVSDTTTRWNSRVELARRERVQLRQLGLLERGWLRNPELPRGPAFMSSPPEYRPTHIPLRVASHHDRYDNGYLGGALWQAEVN